MQFLEKLFNLTEKNTTLRREILAGLTGFISTCYVLFVVPAMLSDAGMDREAATIAVIWTTALASTFMALYANFPVIVAPGLGISAFFAYYVCGPMGLSWQAGLGAVFCSGVIFLLLTVTKIREHIIDAVPIDLKHSIVVGLGCYIAFIGMQNAGIIISNPSTFVGFGDITEWSVLLASLGVLIISTLMIRQIKGAMIIGIVLITIVGLLVGATPIPDFAAMSAPTKFLPTETFGQLDFASVFEYGIVTIVFTLTMVDLFDNMGTLIGLSMRAQLMDIETGKVEGLGKALISDSFATMSSGIIGTPTATSYVESAAAITEGGRTGIVPLVSAVLFLSCLLVLPIIQIVPSYATASVLIVVGALMMQSVMHINLKDLSITVPAFLTILTIPLSFNVATGFGLGFISYVLIKILIGKLNELNFITVLVATAFGINFALR